MTESTTSTRMLRQTDADYDDAALDWLQSEFPEWTIEVDQTQTWDKTLHPLWIARREGDHPQAALTPAKLHTRVTEYLDREARRAAMAN